MTESERPVRISLFSGQYRVQGRFHPVEFRAQGSNLLIRLCELAGAGGGFDLAAAGREVQRADGGATGFQGVR